MWGGGGVRLSCLLSDEGMANDSYGNAMARRSFLFRGKHRDRQTADAACGTSQGVPSRPGSFSDGAAAPGRQGSVLALLSWPTPWSVLDCQTTGVDAGLRVIEIAAIDHNGRTIIETLVNPGVRIPRSATALTGIDEAAVSRAPHWRAVWPKLEDLLLAQKQIIAWSAEFDLRAMRGECARWEDLTWTTAIDARFVDLAPIVSTLAGRECSFEDACALAANRPPAVGEQRALGCCRAALQIIQSLGRNDT
jgi:DNA polymerase III epsilon subunit-like protein